MWPPTLYAVQYVNVSTCTSMGMHEGEGSHGGVRARVLPCNVRYRSVAQAKGLALLTAYVPMRCGGGGHARRQCPSVREGLFPIVWPQVPRNVVGLWLFSWAGEHLVGRCTYGGPVRGPCGTLPTRTLKHCQVALLLLSCWYDTRALGRPCRELGNPTARQGMIGYNHAPAPD